MTPKDPTAHPDEHPMPWEAQAAAGRLVCPRTRSRLSRSADGTELLAAEGGARYPLWQGRVPVLLIDPAAIERDLAGSAMVRGYQAAGGSGPDAPGSRRASGVKRWMDQMIEEGYRSPASESAFDRCFPRGSGRLFVSVGGGPHRDHPAFVNLNMGPFPNVEIIADAHRLPYAEGSVDGIHGSAVLEHLYDPPAAVAEMFRVLKPGGIAYLRTPFLQSYHGYPHHYQNFTLAGHARIFSAAGFTVTESGTDVGPTFALVLMIQTYFQTYFPRLWIKPLQLLWALIAHGVFKRLDRRINASANSHEMASTTYLVARKP